jgi:hypothetical protein
VSDEATQEIQGGEGHDAIVETCSDVEGVWDRREIYDDFWRSRGSMLDATA